MTYEDAIELLRHDKARNCVKGEMVEYWKGFDMAIEALEKQIPKKPKSVYVKGVSLPIPYECPNCGEPVIRYSGYDGVKGEHHCKCGQAIDWTEDKE